MTRRRPRARRPPYRMIPHTADMAFAVRGPTLARLFENAAAALCDIASGGRRAARPRRRVRLAVRGSALDDLLVRWLQEILYLQETRGWRFRRVAVGAMDAVRFTVRGVGTGEPLDPARHPRGREVKAVTYHDLRLVRRAGAWSARVVLDV